MPLPLPRQGLYAITPGSEDFAWLLKQLRRSLEGGAVIVQLRDKQGRLGPSQASQVLTLCHGYDVPLIINDDLELALRIGADGVHLGKEDIGLAEARKHLGRQAIIGVSCYGDLDRASSAAKLGASYVAFGAFYPSASKPDATPAPLQILRQAKELLECPLVAIGGITPENGTRLLEAGADLLAVIGGIFSQKDPCLASHRFRQLFDAPASR